MAHRVGAKALCPQGRDRFGGLEAPGGVDGRFQDGTGGFWWVCFRIELQEGAGIRQSGRSRIALVGLQQRSTARIFEPWPFVCDQHEPGSRGGAQRGCEGCVSGNGPLTALRANLSERPIGHCQGVDPELACRYGRPSIAKARGSAVAK